MGTLAGGLVDDRHNTESPGLSRIFGGEVVSKSPFFLGGKTWKHDLETLITPPETSRSIPENGETTRLLSFWVSAYFQGRTVTFKEENIRKPGHKT